MKEPPLRPFYEDMPRLIWAIRFIAPHHDISPIAFFADDHTLEGATMLQGAQDSDRRPASIRGKTMQMMATASELPVNVTPGDIDHMGHVNNAVYLNWVQAVVVHHWERLAPKEAVATHLWVAIKHEISYRRPAFLEDSIVATTRLEALSGPRATFRTLIQRGSQVLSEAVSTWVCLDASTRRPKKISKDIATQFVGG